MIEAALERSAGGDESPPVLDAAAVEVMIALVTSAPLPAEDVARIDVLRGLERLKCAAEGAQVAVAVDFDASQRARAAERGVRAEK
jgi:hypothetical protein